MVSAETDLLSRNNHIFRLKENKIKQLKLDVQREILLNLETGSTDKSAPHSYTACVMTMKTFWILYLQRDILLCIFFLRRNGVQCTVRKRGLQQAFCNVCVTALLGKIWDFGRVRTTEKDVFFFQGTLSQHCFIPISKNTHRDTVYITEISIFTIPTHR